MGGNRIVAKGVLAFTLALSPKSGIAKKKTLVSAFRAETSA
jgi:hypothetical protein